MLTVRLQLDAMSCQNLDGIIEPEVITMLLKGGSFFSSQFFDFFNLPT